VTVPRDAWEDLALRTFSPTPPVADIDFPLNCERRKCDKMGKNEAVLELLVQTTHKEEFIVPG